MDANATDFYIFGENVKKKDGGTLFSDVSGPLSNQRDSDVRIAWTGGDPTLSATGSTKYDVCLSGKGFKSPAPVSCQFTVKMPSSAATLEFWLIPNGNGKPISYDVTVGGVKSPYPNQSDKRQYRRFVYSITDAKVDESITVTVNNITGNNDWHSLGFLAAQIKSLAKADQTITLGLLSGKTFGDKPFDLTATASSKLPVSYTATGSCTVSGQTVTLTGAGQCTVTASQAGNDQFSAATAVVQSFTIAKATQTLSFTPAKEATLGQSRPLTATVAPSGLSVTFASTTTNVCTVSGTTVQFKAAGACQIKASQPGNDKYEAAPSVTATIMVYPETQTETLPNKVIGEAVNLQANSTSGLPVTYSLAPTSQGCALQETTVTTVSVGTCVVILTQAGNATYLPARTEYRFDIVKGTQVITFTPPASANAGEKLMLTAIGGASKNPVTFASSPTNICTVQENTVSFLATGTCTITANQAGNANYNAATQVSANIVVSNAPKTDQTISFSPALTGTVGQTANLSATASSGLTAITFESSPATVCTVLWNVVSFVSAGNCIVTANQVGNDKFNAAKEVSANIVVSLTQIVKENQKLTLSTGLYGVSGKTDTLDVKVSFGLTNIQLSSETPNICTINGNTVSYQTQGKCTIVVKQAGNEQFNPVEQKINISVLSKGVFSLNVTDLFDTPLGQILEGEILNISITFRADANDIGKYAKFYLKVTNNGQPFMLTSTGFKAATNPLEVLTEIQLTADEVTLPLYEGDLTSGNYLIEASYKTADGNEVKDPANLLVKKGQYLFLTTYIPDIVGDTLKLEAVGGGSNNPITFMSKTLNVCTIQDQILKFIAEGDCTVKITQEGNEEYGRAEITQDIKVKSAGVFEISITNGISSSVTQPTDSDILSIGLIFKAPPEDVGKNAAFYLMVSTEADTFVFVNGGFGQGDYDYIGPTFSSVPKDALTLPLYTGSLPIGSYTIYAAYITEDGKTVEATSILNVVSVPYADAYAKAYADTINKGFSKRTAESYAKSYADAYIMAADTMANSSYKYAFFYADMYAACKDSGSSDMEAKTWATTYASIVTMTPMTQDNSWVFE
jgi:hypothetical protein